MLLVEESIVGLQSLLPVLPWSVEVLEVVLLGHIRGACPAVLLEGATVRVGSQVELLSLIDAGHIEVAVSVASLLGLQVEIQELASSLIISLLSLLDC